MLRRCLGVLFASLLLLIPVSQAQTDFTTRLAVSLNEVRTTQYQQSPLLRDPLLDLVAFNLLPTVAPDCSFVATNDTTTAQTAGYTAEIQVVRLCGVNLSDEQILTTFTTTFRSGATVPMVGEDRYTAVGIALDERAVANNQLQEVWIVIYGAVAGANATIPGADAPPPPPDTNNPPPANISSPLALTASYAIPQLGIQFDYPTGWQEFVAPDFIALVSDPADYTIATDRDSSTKPQNPFIGVYMFPRFAFVADPAATLEDVLKTLNEQLGLTIDAQSMTGVMANRAMTLQARDSNGDYGLITFWQMHNAESIVLMILSTPDAESAQALSADWQTILNSVRPLQTLPLGQDVTTAFGNLNIGYPDGWYMFDGSDRFGLFATRNDYDLYQVGQTALFENVVITLLYQNVNDLINTGLLREPDNLDELLQLNINFLGISNPQVREGWVMGAPAYLVEGANSDGFYTYGAMGFSAGNVYYIQAAALDPQLIQAFKPTFDVMLQNMQQR